MNDVKRRTNWIVICPRRGMKQRVVHLYTVSVYIRNIQCTNSYCWGITVYPLYFKWLSRLVDSLKSLGTHSTPWWHSMELYDVPWNSMDLQGKYMKFHGIPWNSINTSWNKSMAFHGTPWILHGTPWILHGTPWHSMELHGYSIHGIPSISIDFHGFPSIFVEFRGFP